MPTLLSARADFFPGWSRGRLFWTLQAAGWSAALLASLPLLVLGAYEGDWRRALPVGVARVVFAVIVTSAILRPWFRRWRQRLPLGAIAVRVVPLVLAVAASDTVVLGLTFQAVGWGQTAVAPEMQLAGGLLLRSATYLAWGFLYFWLAERMDAAKRELRWARAETAEREAELSVLRAQVNPHFLFNALNVIVAEAADNPRLTRDTAQALAEFLRYSLRSRGPVAPLGEELEAIEHYLAVEQARHGERLECVLETGPGVDALAVPVALLLPLVENAFKFAPRAQPPPWRVEIAIRRLAPDRLRLTVRNTGRWFEPHEAARADLPSHGIGLTNLRRRLELLHGTAAQVRVTTPPGWVQIEVELPVQAEAAVAGGNNRVGANA